MSALPACPQCNSEYTYEDGQMLVCPECAHEWSANAAASSAEDEKLIKDSVGNTLQDGDTITVIKDLKVKGLSLVVKVGTKVKNIRLVDGDPTSIPATVPADDCATLAAIYGTAHSTASRVFRASVAWFGRLLLVRLPRSG